LTVQIRPLDPADDAQMGAWHATYAVAHAHGLEHPAPWTREEMRAQLLHPRSGERVEAFAGYDEGALVGTGMVTFPLMDNAHLAYVDLTTRPEHRRRGHGTAMLEHLTALAVADGRTTLNADAAWPYEAPADGAGTPNADFLTARGFVFSLGDVKRALDVPVDDGLLTRLAADVAPYHRGYELRRFAGPVPEDIVDSFGALIGSLMTQAPMGELDVEPEVFDATRIRDDEKVFEASGRRKYTTVAVAPGGDVVAYSELVVPSFDPGHLFQWGTLVLPEHRGHRLGLATKVHNLQFLQEHLDHPRVLFTYNAEVNDHMIAVNEVLGFRPVERLGEFQKKL
jgi:GNAT superfamily N-acetyltransferase